MFTQFPDTVSGPAPEKQGEEEEKYAAFTAVDGLIDDFGRKAERQQSAQDGADAVVK